MTAKETIERIKQANINWTDYDLKYGCVFCEEKVSNVLINETPFNKWIEMLFVCKKHRNEIFEEKSGNGSEIKGDKNTIQG